MPRVLIVDDHAFIRRGVQTILHPFPEWELCGEADNGSDAIRMAEELKPEVIIMDLSMPGLNGIEATRAIRKNSTWRQDCLADSSRVSGIGAQRLSRWRKGVSPENRCRAGIGEGPYRGDRTGNLY